VRRLGTEYLDLLWVHFPDGISPVCEVVRGFADLARGGQILYANLNFPALLASLAPTVAEARGEIPLAAVQFEYSPVESSADL
jgi:aryl-alcohol dehydrogenase-like predicted oxidoreductase